MAAVSTDSGDHVELNVMPMLDIFSILITFLLMSFSTDPVSYDANAEMELPHSETVVALDALPTITVTKAAVFLGDKQLAKIVGDDVDKASQDQGAIRPLYDELEKYAERNKALLKDSPEAKKANSTLTIEVDKNHQFKVIRRVMLSGQQAGFVVYKLMTTRDAG